MKKKYQPWRAQRALGNLLLFVAPAVCALLAYLMQSSFGVLAAISALSIFVGLRMRRRVGARMHGQAVEAQSVARAMRELTKLGFTLEAGRMTRLGDIDLVGQYAGKTATIEIKAFHYWRSRWMDRRRQDAARSQARNQKNAIGADVAVVWLPHARPTWLTRVLNTILPEDNPIVVMGNEHRLGRVVQHALVMAAQGGAVRMSTPHHEAPKRQHQSECRHAGSGMAES